MNTALHASRDDAGNLVGLFATEELADRVAASATSAREAIYTDTRRSGVVDCGNGLWEVYTYDGELAGVYGSHDLAERALSALPSLGSVDDEYEDDEYEDEDDGW